MGRLEREARDVLVEQQKKRLTVFAELPHQTFMVHGIKAPAIESLMVLISPASGSADKVKALLRLRRVLKDFERNFPEPTRENTWHPNSWIMIDIRDRFFRDHCIGLSAERLKTMRLGINFFIIIYDYDPPYRMMIDWWAKQLDIKNWDYQASAPLFPRNWPWWKD